MSSGRKGSPLRRFAVRTTLGFTAVLAVAVLIVATGVYWGLRHNLYREADEFLEGEIREELHHWRTGDWGEGFIRADVSHAVNIRREDRLFFRYFDGSGRALWTVPEAMADRCLPAEEDIRYALDGGRRHLEIAEPGDRYLTLVFPVPRSDEAHHACQIGMSVAAIEARCAKYASILAGVSVVVVAGGAAVSYVLVRRPLRILRDISNQAREISARALHLRLPVSGAGDEFDDLSETLNGMLERLQDSVRRLRQFTGDAAHELRGPVSRMRAAAEVALHGRHGDAELREALADVAEEADGLGRLINDLLLLAQADADSLAGDAEVIDCRGVLEEALALYEGLAEEKGVALRLEAAEPGRVHCVRKRLLQALGNLIENAIKFTEPGGTVRMDGCRAEGMYRFAVRDTGVGIGPEHLPHIFDRFYRADPARPPQAGAGLGLSIVRVIAEARGGRVDVESRPGVGSTFTLVLPASETA